MAVQLAPPSPATDILPTLLHRYLAPKSPVRPWLLTRKGEDDEGIGSVSSSLRGDDISHAYTTTCTAQDAPDRAPNDLRVMHRMDDGFALGSAAAMCDKLLPYSKDPIAGNTKWAPMKWRRFATDLKVDARCEYVEVGEMENGRWVITVFVIQESTHGAMGINADVLYYDDGSVLLNSMTGNEVVKKADMRVSLRGLHKDDAVCRFCNVRDILRKCDCSEHMRKRCGLVPTSAVIDRKRSPASRVEGRSGSSSAVVTHGSSGLTMWDRFLEKQRSLDRVATVTYTVYSQNRPVFVNPFRLRLIYGRTKDTDRIFPIFLQRTTKTFKWARASPISRIANYAAYDNKEESRESVSIKRDNEDGVRDDRVLIEELPGSECGSSTCNVTSQSGPVDGVGVNPKESAHLSSLEPHPLSLATGIPSAEFQQRCSAQFLGYRENVGKVRKFPCDLCDRAFVSKGHLSRHRRSVHEKKPALPCLYCDREFRDEGHRTHHMSVVHTDRRRTDGATESDFRCVTCGFAFVRKYTLLRHIKLVHDKHRVKCRICGKQMGQRCDLKRHIVRVHGGHGMEVVAKAERMTVTRNGRSSSRSSRPHIVTVPPIRSVADIVLDTRGPAFHLEK